MEKLPLVDGFDEWRQIEKSELTAIIQNRITNLQTPSNCSETRLFICKHRNECGFSCNLDHLVCCLITAYGTERTLILQPKKYNYYEGGYENVFEPLSVPCLNHEEENFPEWPGRVKVI